MDRCYCSTNRSESEFYRLFSTIKAVPRVMPPHMVSAYRPEKMYDAMKFVVPLALGQYHKLKSKNLVSENKN